jgi:Ca2+-binding EF-hand superfamily protein
VRRPLHARQNGNDKKELSLDKLGATLNAICNHKQFSDQEVRELFNKADLDGSRSISFREFLIAVGVGYFLRVNVCVFRVRGMI